MANEERMKKEAAILEKLGKSVHSPPAFFRQQVEKLKAKHSIETNELEAIYHLVESHGGGFRLKAILRSERKLTASDTNKEMTMDKKFLEFNCINRKMDDNINDMLEKVKEMPSEWTIVQVTSHYNCKEFTKIDINTHYTNALYLTVFNCGQGQLKPFCVSVEAPKDNTGTPIELMNKVCSVKRDFEECKIFWKSAETRRSLDNTLKECVKDFQDLYLKEWKCFLMGKYTDVLEKEIQDQIKKYYKIKLPNFNLDEKTLSVIHYLIKSSKYLTFEEIERALQATIPILRDDDYRQIRKFIRNINKKLSLSKRKRGPIILIVDDSLDCFPWEMMKVLADAQLTRLRSLHLVYASFQEHKDSIKEGFVIVNNPQNGRYILNPENNLKPVETRISSFYEYWLPDWKGVAGTTPTQAQFEESLLSADIFVYRGHNNGGHLFSIPKIENMRINAVVILLGCSSSTLEEVGYPVEMSTDDDHFFIACSPCIVGTLWINYNIEMDIFSTDFFSEWIPNVARKHWKVLDKTTWTEGKKKVNFTADPSNEVPSEYPRNEPRLAQALSNVKKKTSNLVSYFLKADVVARGLPVKIVTK